MNNMRKQRCKIWLLLLLSAAVTFGFGNNVYPEKIARIIAQVNDEIITAKDLDDYCNILHFKDPRMQITPEFKSEVFERLIEDKLILSQAIREGIKVSDAWVNEKLNEFISSYPSYRDFEESLIADGLNVTLLKKRLESQYLTQRIISKHVRSKVYISPAQVTEFYQSNQEEFAPSRVFTLWISKSEFDEQLQMLTDEIKEKGIEGVDREKYNLNQLDIPERSLKEDIKDIVLSLNIGDSTIEKIDGIYYYVYLENIQAAQAVQLEEAKERIYAFLWEQEMRRIFTEWLEALKEDTVIKRYYE